jgi:hypothetical protein
MTRRKRNSRRPKRVPPKFKLPKTVNEAAPQSKPDNDAGKLKAITDHTLVPAAQTHFQIMSQKWEEQNKLVSPDWETADRQDRRRFIVGVLGYALKSKKRT